MEEIIILLLLKTVLIILLINEGRHGWMSFWTPPTCTVDQSSWNILQNIYFCVPWKKESDCDERQVNLKCCKPDSNSQCPHDHQGSMCWNTSTWNGICNWLNSKFDIFPSESVMCIHWELICKKWVLHTKTTWRGLYLNERWKRK